MSLRPYQEDALSKIIDGFNEHRRQLAVLPTGAGKTILFSHLVSLPQFQPALILAHRDELIKQAADKLNRTTSIVADFEAAEYKADMDSPVVVGSVQTMMRASRLLRFRPDHFKLIVVDEAHHVLASSYLNILEHFSPAFVLGVTATPDRSDKKNLGKFFQNVAYEIMLLDLIKQKFLCPIKVQTMPLDIDLSPVRTTAGDYNSLDLGNVIDPYLEIIVKKIIPYRDRKILVFLPLIDTSKKMCELFNKHGFSAEHVDGTSSDRSEILKRFSNDECRVLCNAMLLTEGYDEPTVDCVVCLRPTKSRSLYSQIVGRGTRIHPNKDHLLLLDFLWASQEHNLIKPAHLISKDKEIAKEISEKIGGFGDLEEAEACANADRTRRLQERLAMNAKRKAKIFDAMDFALSIGDSDIADYVATMEWEEEPISEKQRQILISNKIDPDSVKCKGHAIAIIDKIFLRRSMNLATAAQVRLLMRLGVSNPERVTFEQASKIITLRLNR
jgi:superfamily II DNA or RNA helicase